MLQQIATAQRARATNSRSATSMLRQKAGAGEGGPTEYGDRRAHPAHQADAIIEKRHPRNPPGSGLGQRPRTGALGLPTC
jgi:hypothetical protein